MSLGVQCITLDPPYYGGYNPPRTKVRERHFSGFAGCGRCKWVVLYCAEMDVKDSQSGRLSTWLHCVGLHGFVADLLEAMGPLMYLGAQAAYLLEPMANGAENPIGSFARFLEDPERISGFIASLREEGEA